MKIFPCILTGICAFVAIIRTGHIPGFGRTHFAEAPLSGQPGNIDRGLHRLILLLAATIVGTGCATTQNQQSAAPTTAYRTETLVSGGPLHGAKGITFGPDGHLYVCSVYAQSIYRVNVATGEVTTAVGAPHGESDDVAFAPDGTMAWTALPSGEIRARHPGGEPYVLASKLPLINPVGYTDDGRLFAAQIGIDRFLEIDTSGAQPPRIIAKGIGHLNSFEITSDGQLYGPLAGINKVARIDLASGEVTHISGDLGMLSAVNMDSTGRLYAVGWASGQLLRINPATGDAEVVTTIDPPLDNLAIDSDDMIYVSQPAKGAIVKVDPATGAQSNVVPGNIGIPGGLTISMHAGRETLIVADDFGFRHVDTQTGEVFATIDLAEFMDPSAATDVAANDDFVVLTDVTRSRVYMIDRKSNATVNKWKRVGTVYGVILTDAGMPIIADYDNGTLVQLSTTDRNARKIVAEGLNGPVGLTRAGPDSVFVSETVAGRVLRVNLNNGSREIVAEDLSRPEGLTVLKNGHVVIVEVGKQRVIEIDPATGASTVLADQLPVGAVVPEAPAPVYVPSGIVAANDGSLYLSSDIDHSLIRLVPDR
jgi:streptogramin lyase